mgnify:CR=1 FL=1
MLICYYVLEKWLKMQTEQLKFDTFEDAQKVKAIAKVIVLATEQILRLGYQVLNFDMAEYPNKLFIEIQKKNGVKFWVCV